MLAAFIFVVPLPAASPAISAVADLCQLTMPDPALDVFFSSASPLNAADVGTKENWTVLAVYSNGAKPPIFSGQALDVDRIDTTQLASGHVVVHLHGTVPTANLDHITVQYHAAVGASSKDAKPPDGFKCGPPTAKEILGAASGKSDADINLNGSVSPAVGAGPTYATDSSLAFKLAGKHPEDDWWALAASAKTDNRRVVDPSSFRWRFAWQQAAQKLYFPNFDIGVAGMEFDVTGQAINILASPRFVSPVLLRQWSDKGALAGVVELDIYGGVEAGRNLKDSFLFSGNTRLPGTGALLRGVPGATLTFKQLKKVTFTSDYQVRLLAEPEIFLETRHHTKNPIPEIRQQPRNHWVNSITYTITDALGLTVQHEVGSLPPAYTFIQNKVTIGFTLLLKENRTLRIY